MALGLLVDGVNEREGAMRELAFELGLDPDGKEFGAEVAVADLVEVNVAATGVGGDVEVFVEEALRRVGVSVNHDGGIVDGAGVGFRRCLGHDDGSESETREQQSDQRGAPRKRSIVLHWVIESSGD